MMKKRLLWQLYPSYLLITTLALLVVAFHTSRSLRLFYQNQVAKNLTAKAKLIEEQIRPLLTKQDFAEINNLCVKLGKASSTRITIILPGGEVAGDSDQMPSRMENHADRAEFIEAIQKGLGKSVRFSRTVKKNMMYVAIPLRENGNVAAVVRTSLPVTDIEEELGRIYKKIIWAVIVAALFTAAVSLLTAKKISRPVEQMRETAKRFADGQLNLRIPAAKTFELSELAESLNEMARQLSDRINTITTQRNELEAVLSSMVEGVIATDDWGHIVSINKAAAVLLGVQPENVRGRNIEEVVRNVELQNFVKQTLDNQQPAETEIHLFTDGESYFRVHGTTLATTGEGGETGAVMVLRDMTRLRRLENIRRDFVANVSHELKTPVTSIKGFVETLLDGAINEPTQARRFLEIIAKHTDRLNSIIEDLLSLSRLEEEGEKRRISFQKERLLPVLKAAAGLAKIKADEKRISITISCDEQQQARVNSALLEQAVLNLIDNAIKYSEPGSQVKVAAEEQDDTVRISVEDSGCGIATEHLERIFERFYVIDKGRSRKLGGTGLGLAIVKHISQAHGGSVTVKSVLGKGSTFTIHLPKLT